MRVPIYLEGEEAGELTLERRGAWTLLDARLRDAGRVLRLTLYGERPFYLGVPVPEGEGLRLTRRLSAAEASRLPRTPTYAAEKPGDRPEAEPTPARVLWLGGRPHYF